MWEHFTISITNTIITRSDVFFCSLDVFYGDVIKRRLRLLIMRQMEEKMHFDYQRGEYFLSKQLPRSPPTAGQGGWEVLANDFFMGLTLYTDFLLCVLTWDPSDVKLIFRYGWERRIHRLYVFLKLLLKIKKKPLYASQNLIARNELIFKIF